MTARRLVLIRHAHAESGGPDEQRVLSSRGRAEAAAVGRWLGEHDVLPDVAVVSPATRARETWHHASAELRTPVPASTDRRLYDNTVENVLTVLVEQDDAALTVAVVGHYPSLPATVVQLTGHGVTEFPTATIAVLDVDTPWSDLRTGTLASLTSCQS